MPFTCPDCSGKYLEIVLAMELPPDSRSDEITLQVIKCSHCGFTSIGVYEESRRGVLGSEAWEHGGFRAGRATLDEIMTDIRSCPRPQDQGCRCPAHQRLGSQDKTGRWNGLSGLHLHSYFLIIYSPDESER